MTDPAPTEEELINLLRKKEPSYPTIVTQRRAVPNQQPYAEPAPYRIAIIGEAPGEDEENYGVPFVGRSGQHLDRELRASGIDRNRCFVGNICQVRPPANNISLFDWSGPEIQEGLAKLKIDLDLFNPHLCVLVGATPLRAAKGSAQKITDWRGSLFTGYTSSPFFSLTIAGVLSTTDLESLKAHSPFFGRKCLAALHPAFILREFEYNPQFGLDLRRARAEGESSSLDLPVRELITNYDAATLCHILDTWPSGQRCSVDIEGGIEGWPCVSVCAIPTKSITIAWGKFDEHNHGRVLQSFARLMGRRDVPKVLQNSLYDNFVLSYAFGIPIRNVVEDTMLKQWEIYCELPKGLGTICSIWTREPFYKSDRKSDDGETFFKYCAKDSAVTLEACNAMDSAFPDVAALGHYRKNVEMLNPLLYMELRGIRYDQEQVNLQLKENQKDIEAVAEALNKSAGSELRGKKGSLSSQRLAKVLYSEKGYPPQYKKEQGRKTEKLTTDVEAILSLRRKLPGDDFLNGILRHRHLEGILETLSIKPDSDERVRCGYNVVGTETGRLTCYTSPTGAGANLQTITKKLRVNYCADPGYDFFQCDLAGADGWTVAAHCARLGDSTMLEDYYAGLKPARILALLYELGADINLLDRPSLANVCRAVDSDGWLYFSSKRTQHGSNYLMGIPTMQTQIMKDSFKLSGTPIYMEHHAGRRLQEMYFSRYTGVRTWHAWAQSKLVADGTLTSASGHTRVFFGRRFGKDIHDTVKQFLADEPQQNTTWATNLAMLKLWNDPENRRPDGSLIIEPLHQVHDALCGQWPIGCRNWARAKVRSYFNNELTIAGMKLVIPFDGGYGPSWGTVGDKYGVGHPQAGQYKPNCGSI